MIHQGFGAHRTVRSRPAVVNPAISAVFVRCFICTWSFCRVCFSCRPVPFIFIPSFVQLLVQTRAATTPRKLRLDMRCHGSDDSAWKFFALVCCKVPGSPARRQSWPSNIFEVLSVKCCAMFLCRPVVLTPADIPLVGGMRTAKETTRARRGHQLRV